MDQSTIDFLDSLEEKEETNIPINDTSIDEVLAEPELDPAIIEDDNLLPPRADDPAFTSAEKVEYDYDEDNQTFTYKRIKLDKFKWKTD